MTEEQLVQQLKIIQRTQQEFELNFVKAIKIIEKAHAGSIATSNQIEKLMKQIDIFHTTLKFNQKR